MFSNYLIIGWRNLIRTKGYSLINIFGLATAMAITILIGLWIQDELNYNKSFKNYERLGQVYHHIELGEEGMTINDVPAPIGDALKNTYPDFEALTITSWPGDHIVSRAEKKLSPSGMFVSPEFIDMFSVQFVEGSFTSDLHAIVISKTLATALTGENPIGKMIKVDNRDEFMVTGVFEDFPSNSRFATIELFLPMAYHFSINDAKQMNNWEDYSFQCFALLKPAAAFNEAGSKIKKVLYDHASGDGKVLNPEGFLFPMSQWHLYDTFDDGATGAQIRFVWMFGTIGIFVLLLACINFMNLSTARSEKRAKEVGVRKVMGSARKQLVFQFLSESLLIVVLGYLLALLIASLSLPAFNDLTGKKISIPWTNPNLILLSVSFILVTGLVAGSYPALFLSAFNPVTVLKGAYKAGRFASLPRKILVVFQFTTSVVLIIATLIVFLQIRHAKDRPVGFDREGIFHITIRTDDLAKANYNALRHELLATGVVANMAISDAPITGTMSGDASIMWEGKDPALKPLIAMNSCSHDFPKTNGFQFVEGRDFSRELVTDTAAVIINEIAARLISPGTESVIGKKIRWGYGKEREIIGVIKDQVRWTAFVNQSAHLYYINYDAMHSITVRLNPGSEIHNALQRVESVVKKFEEGALFEYEFLDDDYAQMFHHEERVSKLASVFSLLAILISCTGIFGLAAFASSQRTKEIGIRKVLGASVFSVWRMLSRDFVLLVLISLLLGTPLAYYFANQWLQQYEYRIDVPWLIFIITGVLVMTITLLTISYQALKAALMNPVKSIRTE